MSDDARRALSQLLGTDAFEARMVVRRGAHYVLLVRRATGRTVRFELGSEDAGPRLRPDDAVRARLGSSGYARMPGESRPRPWAAVLDGRDEARLLERAEAGLDAMGADAGPLRVELAFDAEAPPENPRLLEAMRVVARNSQVGARQALYAALVNANLLVPIDPESLGGAVDEQRPMVVDQLQGAPVIAAFSDVASLRSWRHTGHPWAAVQGAEFFSHAERAEVGAVRINPAGTVGGELYRNEVEAIVEGVRRFHARRMN